MDILLLSPVCHCGQSRQLPRMALSKTDLACSRQMLHRKANSRDMDRVWLLLRKPQLHLLGWTLCEKNIIIRIIIITVSANPKPEGHMAYTQSVCSHICGACRSGLQPMMVPY